MKYSYIKPRRKLLFSADMKLFGVFFGSTIFVLFCTYLFLIFNDYKFTQDKLNIMKLQKETSTEIDIIEKEIIFIKEEQSLSESIYTKNTVLKDSISNIFDLVPQRITLSEAKLLENGLILYGITPNKDIYNFMLQAPLRSIFHSTNSSFYPAENGWLHFISTNYIEGKEEHKEDMKHED